MRFLVLFVLWCLTADSAHAAPPPDVAAARALAARARAHLDLRQPEQAARLFDSAHGQEAHPLWLLASGEAWLEALRPELAVPRLEAALADQSLVEPARQHAAERLALARTLLPLIRRARDPETRAVDALTAWREAFAASNIGRCLLEAARVAERAQRVGDADELYARVAEREDVSSAERRAAGDALVRLRERDAFTRDVPPPAPRSEAGWAFAIGGAVAIVGGVAAWLVGESQRAEVRDAKGATGPDGITTRLSRTEAQSLERSANTWSTVGWVAAGVGFTALTVGVVMLETRPMPRGAVITARVAW
jgi:hypothetical protein